MASPQKNANENQTKIAANSDEIDLEAIRNISLEISSSDKGEASSPAEYDGDASLQDIMREPEHPKYGSKSKISEGSFNNSSSLNGSQNFKVKPITTRADHESAFDLTWEEKQRAILMRREACKPAVKFIPPTRKDVDSDAEEDEQQQNPDDMHFDDERKGVWAQGRKNDKERVLEDHDNGFRLTWDEKQQVIADRRLAGGA